MQPNTAIRLKADTARASPPSVIAITDAKLSPRYDPSQAQDRAAAGPGHVSSEPANPSPAPARHAAVEPALRMGNILDFRFGNFEIDAARQELRRAGEAVHIEPQVFDLLVHLVQNRDRIVSKDELIETIWRGRISRKRHSAHASARRGAHSTTTAMIRPWFAPCTSAGFASSATSPRVPCRQPSPQLEAPCSRLQVAARPNRRLGP